MHFVVIVTIISTIISGAFLVYAFGDFSNSHSLHPVDIKRDGTVNVEDILTIERGGEAKFYSRLVLDNNVIDPSNNCEFCNKIEYIPGSEGKAGVAYRNEKLDLSRYHRIVFFARGQHGDEVVSFIAIGRGSLDPSLNKVDTFPYQDFAITSRNVTLDNVWKRYEISLNNTNLEDVTHPFGFVITGHEPEVKQTFYLKGVTFDRKSAQHPLQIANTSSNNSQKFR